MDEVTAVCRRLLGDERAAARCAEAAGADAGRDERLTAALACCRAQAPETAAAGAQRRRRRGRRRGVCALRWPESCGRRSPTCPSASARRWPCATWPGLSHTEMGTVLGVEPAAAVALLIRARLSLRGALRGEALPSDSCPEHERALRTITLRIDAEPVLEADDDWLVEHLGHCDGCRQAHATLLEAAACYRGWPR